MTANHVSVKQQHAFRLPIPPIKNQRVIGDVLGALDDKIELNRRMNRTLAEIAKTLFKSWFIDFDPVQAKIEGRSPEGMDAETAALFPDAFKESELGLIPKGWIVKPASDALEIVGGFTPSTRSSAYWQGGTVPFATHEDLSRLDSPVLLRTNKKITRAGVNAINAGLLPASTILLSSRVPISRLAISQAPTAIGQGIIAIPPNEQLPPHFILHWLDFNSRKIERHAEGSTLLEINERSFRSMSMQLPMKDVVKAFSRRTANLYRMIMTNDIETSRLREVRKTLLPRLLSGILLTKIDAGPRQSQ
jgi:type I restriction enzyme S subunit